MTKCSWCGKQREILDDGLCAKCEANLFPPDVAERVWALVDSDGEIRTCDECGEEFTSDTMTRDGDYWFCGTCSTLAAIDNIHYAESEDRARATICEAWQLAEQTGAVCDACGIAPASHGNYCATCYEWTLRG